MFLESDAKATRLFRIVQEAVTNSIKHGRARQIEIRLSASSNRIALAVSDNGTGLKKGVGLRKGLGLRIMTYRAGVIGGTLVVRNHARGGVEIICTVDEANA